MKCIQQKAEWKWIWLAILNSPKEVKKIHEKAGSQGSTYIFIMLTNWVIGQVKSSLGALSVRINLTNDSFSEISLSLPRYNDEDVIYLVLVHSHRAYWPLQIYNWSHPKTIPISFFSFKIAKTLYILFSVI